MFTSLKLELSRELERERTADSRHPRRQHLRGPSARLRWLATIPNRIEQEERS